MYDALSSGLCSIQTVSDRQRKHPSHEKTMILSMSTSNLIVMVYYTILYYGIHTSFSSMITYIYIYTITMVLYLLYHGIINNSGIN